MGRFCLLAAGIGAVLLAACGHRTEGVTLAHGALRVNSHEVSIESSAGPEAHLYPDGRLQIGSEELALDSAAHAAVVGYFNAAQAVTEHAIETGKAGAAVGMTAAKEVVSGLAHGDTSGIGAKVQSKAEEVRASAARICDDLTALHGVQGTLVASVERFRPYAAVTDEDIADCRKDMEKH